MFTYLLTGSFGEYFLFYGLAEFYIYIMLWLEGIGPSCPTFFPLSSPGVLARDSPHLFTATSLFKNWFSLPLFPLPERGGYFRFGILANHLASIFFSPLSDDSLGLLYVPIPHSLSIRSQSANIRWLSLWPTFFTFSDWPAEVHLHYYSSF